MSQNSTNMSSCADRAEWSLVSQWPPTARVSLSVGWAAVSRGRKGPDGADDVSVAPKVEVLGDAGIVWGPVWMLMGGTYVSWPFCYYYYYSALVQGHYPG